MMRMLFGLAVTMLFLVASCDGTKPNSGTDNDTAGPAVGTEGGPCYPNGTCNDDLQCLSDICVEMPDALNDETSADEDKIATEEAADKTEGVALDEDIPSAEGDEPETMDDMTEPLDDEANLDDAAEPTDDEAEPVDDMTIIPDAADADGVDADTVDVDVVDIDSIDVDTVDIDTIDEDIVPDADPTVVLCTGQTKCYDNTEEIACPTAGNDFFGQDAQYAAAGYCTPRDYTVSGAAGNDIVTDNVIGLIWQRTVNTTTYTWDNATTYCDNLTYGGYSDWRLPTRKELATLPDYGRYDPAIDATIFSGTQSSYYWSSSSYAPWTANAWRVHFGYGLVYDEVKTVTHYARCVRGAASLPDDAFTESTVSGKVIVTDTGTGLIWTKEYNSSVTWQNALSYCEGLNYGGATDWRLPNIEELKTLIDDTIYSPASTFPGMPSEESFWSSSSYAGIAGSAWIVSFFKGIVGYPNKTTTHHARCVRSKPGTPDNDCVTLSNPCDDGGDVVATCTDEVEGYTCDCSLNYTSDGTTCVADNPPSGVLCTGQTNCYNATVEMTCPTEGNDFYGQDAQYAAAGHCTPRDYTVSGSSGNDIVTDNVTGLIWQRTVNTTTYTWDNATTYCGNLTYGGYSDWRLPTRKELATLPDYGRYGPAIDTTIFPGTQSDYYWSSLFYVNYPGFHWYMSSDDGVVSYSDSTFTHYARCVRGAASLPDDAFTESTVSGKVIVTDTGTGLIWTKEYNSSVTWQNALSYCEGLNYGGAADWRLPNIEELKTLIDDTIYSPASTFPGMPSNYFWSSSSYASFTDYAWFVDFSDGRIDDYNKTYTYHARCVRQ